MSNILVESVARISLGDGITTFVLRDQNDKVYIYEYEHSLDPKPYTVLVLALAKYGDVLSLYHSEFKVSYDGKKPYTIRSADFARN